MGILKMLKNEKIIKKLEIENKQSKCDHIFKPIKIEFVRESDYVKSGYKGLFTNSIECEKCGYINYIETQFYIKILTEKSDSRYEKVGNSLTYDNENNELLIYEPPEPIFEIIQEGTGDLIWGNCKKGDQDNE